MKNYVEKIATKIAGFSGSFMSDTKWIKVFTVLFQHSELIEKCQIKDILDDCLREVRIREMKNFDTVFYANGIRDGISAGSCRFKEMERIVFPSSYTLDRPMGKKLLKPFIITQDLVRIADLLYTVGQLEMDTDDNELVVYGYK